MYRSCSVGCCQGEGFSAGGIGGRKVPEKASDLKEKPAKKQLENSLAEQLRPLVIVHRQILRLARGNQGVL